jgi:hypothetical protein
MSSSNEDDENIRNGPSLIWAVKTAFTNYQTIITKYETLLSQIITLNTSINVKLEEFNDKLQNIPDKKILVNVENKMASISEKLTKIFLIISIVSGIGIATYVWVNKHIDSRIETLFKQTSERVIKSQSKDSQSFYIIDDNGNKIPVAVENK